MVQACRAFAMKVIIDRNYQVRQTLGNLYVVGTGGLLVQVKSLELPYLDNQQHVSCIPPGEYNCVRIHSRKFGISYLLEDVPDRSEIMLHIGNYATGDKVDTSGCILVGLEFIDLNLDGYLDVKDSTIAMNVLRALLPAKFKIYLT